MLVRLEGKGRLNQRLFRGLRRAIVERRLAPASRLPSTRALAADLGVSRNVVLLAFAQLVAEGYADGRGGSGTFVAATLPDPRLEARAASPPAVTAGPNPRLSAYARRVVALAPLPAVGRPARPGLVYDFRYGVPAVAEFPQQAWARLTQRRLRTMSVKTLRYGRALGWLPLREAIADYVTRTRGVAATFEQVVIVNGSQQALDLVARLLIDPGDRVVVEEPSYLSARQVFLRPGPSSCPCLWTKPAWTSRNCRRRGRFAWLRHPVTSVSAWRRAAAGAPARAAAVGGTERERSSSRTTTTASSGTTGNPIEAIQGLDAAGRVIYVGTFSKVLFPSLRLGYLIVPPALRAAARRAQVPRRSARADLRTGGAGRRSSLAGTSNGTCGAHERAMRRGVRPCSRPSTSALGRPGRSLGANAGLHMVVWLRDVARR